MRQHNPDQSNVAANGTTVSVCTDCKERWYYERALCPSCGAAETRTDPVGIGTLVATTTAHVTPAGVRAVNPLGLASFDHEINVLAQLPGDASQQPGVGDNVQLVGDHRLRDGMAGPRLQVAGSTQGVSE